MTTPDIFLSYNREDAATAKLYADAFAAEGLNVWWDATLRSGEAYDEVTEAALRGAKAVVVLWSPRSVVSRWVRAEATIADRCKTLVPVMIEACERPIMFELTQTAELSHWTGDTGDRAWLALLGDVLRFVERGGPAPAPVAEVIPAPTPAKGKAHGHRPAVAILPFTNRSEERADEVFAGGMVEDIAGALSLGRGLKVISQGTTAAYRKNTSDLRAIGRELGAKYILEGNVRRVGATLRVTAQLVEAENGAILWTQKFDRPLSELAELQEQLVEEVTAHLGVQIQKVEMERALRKPGDITAWEAVMRSWAAYARLTTESMIAAITEARRAVKLAPDYAVARGTLAMALGIAYGYSGYRDRAMLDEALEHAEAALALNPGNATVLFQVAHSYNNALRFDEGFQLAERAVEINPNLVDARQSLALGLIHLGRFDEALEQLAEGDRLSPRAFQQVLALGHRCWALAGLGRFEEALAVVTNYVRVDPTGRYPLYTRAVFLQQLGRADEAKQAVQAMRRALPNESFALWLTLIRNSYLPMRLREVFEANLTAAWESVPEEGA
jgi:TolB-like protein/tetratricopeptide (TPR) repeat protein